MIELISFEIKFILEKLAFLIHFYIKKISFEMSHINTEIFFNDSI